MRQITTIAASLLSIATSTLCLAALAYPSGVIPAPEAASQAKSIKYSIQWINSLPEAQERARREHKPVFWLHILGNIDGFA
jgi:hypothetical protein